MAAVNPLCVENLQSSTDSPRLCRGRNLCLFRCNHTERGAFRRDCLRQERFRIGKRDGIQQGKVTEAVFACEYGLTYTITGRFESVKLPQESAAHGYLQPRELRRRKAGLRRLQNGL